MDLKRKILLIAATSIFRFAVYFAALATALVMVFHNSSSTKEALLNSGTYDQFVPAAIDSYLKESKSADSLPLEDPKLQQIIRQSFTPRTLQTSAETVIDSSYAWLNGDRPTLKFRIDFTPNINTLADELSRYAFDRFAFLPPCPPSTTEVNPFTINCNPAPVNTEAQRVSFANELRASGIFLSKTVFTEADLPKTQKGKTIVQQYPYAPAVFQMALWLPWILALIAVASGYAIIVSGARKRGGFSYIGGSIAGTGAFLAASPLFFIYVLPYFIPNYQANANGAGLQAVMNGAAKALSGSFNNRLIIIGLLLVVAGMLIWLFERSSRPVSRYRNVRKKSGLVSSILPRTSNGRFRLNPDRVPIQTSEGTGRDIKKPPKNKKYRKIPKKEL